MPNQKPTYDELLNQNMELAAKLATISSFRRIFDRAWGSKIFGMARIDKNGLIQNINPYAAGLFNKTAEELISTSIIDYFNPFEKEEISKFISSTVIDKEILEAAKFHIISHPEQKTVIINFEFADYPQGEPSALLVIRDVTDIEKYSAELKEKELFLNQAQKIGNFGHFIFDIQNSLWNGSSELLQILGLKHINISDIDLWIALVHPDDRQKISDYLFNDVIKSCKPFNKEYRIIRPSDGEVIWLHKKGELRFNSEGEPIKLIGTIQDITERKNIENEIIASKALYHDMVEALQDLVWQCDINGKFVFVNKAWEKTLGYSSDEIIGHHFSEFSGVDYAEKDNAMVSQLLYNGIITSYETIHYHKNGDAVILSFNGKTIINEKGETSGIRGTARNITEKKKAEKLLHEKTEELDRYFNTSLDLLALTNEDGRFVRVNPEWEKVLGFSLEELINKTLWDFIHPDDISMTLETNEKLIKGEDVLDFINRFRCKNGQYKYIEWRSAKVGNIIYAAARDVTGKKELEERLTNTNKYLTEINAQKDKFLYIIAHDIRNPLNNIISSVDLLNRSFLNNSPKENKKLVELLREGTITMFELIENLLNWALSQTGKIHYQPSEVNLKPLAQKIIIQVLPMATPKNIEIINNLTDNDKAWADETMMGTVLRNLVSNAVKFSLPGNKVEINIHKNSKKITIEIKDYGIGINPDVIEGLFQLENVYLKKGTSGEKGTGFGLPLCREFMDRQGGVVRAISEPEKGSSFYVELPIKPVK